MAYTPINWQTGDVITAEKLNKMDNGWGITNETQTFYDGTVTTQTDGDVAYQDFAPSKTIDSDVITVTFNGTEYECPNIGTADPEYGAPYNESISSYDFSTFPFNIYALTERATVTTETAGTYTLKIEAGVNAVSVSEDFKNAVESVVDANAIPMQCVSNTTTYDDMLSADENGKMLYFKANDGTFIITSFSESVVNFMPTDTGVNPSFSNGIFVVVTQ